MRDTGTRGEALQQVQFRFAGLKNAGVGFGTGPATLMGDKAQLQPAVWCG